MKEDLTRSVPQTQKITLGEKADTGRKLGFKSNVADAATDQTGLRRKGRRKGRWKGRWWKVLQETGSAFVTRGKGGLCVVGHT